MSEVLGLLFAVIIGLSFVPKLSALSQKASDNTRAVTTAEQQKKLIDASTSYIQQYSTNLQSVATATNPAIITVAMLQSVKLLDGSFSPTNPYGQTWQTGVLQPSAGNLQALAMSYGGTALNDMVASKIASLVGAQGGFIPKNDSGIYPAGAGAAYGSYSGWTIPTANYTSVSGGRLAALLTFSSGQLTSNYLYRNAVPGQPQLNKMGTAIDMGGNNVDNAGTVNATTVSATGNVAAVNRVTAGEYVQIKGTVVEGSACPSNDLVARDASGLILSCQSGSWRRQSKASYTDQFNGGFVYAAAGWCSSGIAQRTYTLTLDSDSIVFGNIVSTNADPLGNAKSYNCISMDGVLCGVGGSTTNTSVQTGSSASCSMKLTKGTHTIIFEGSFFGLSAFYGTISMWPL